MERCSKLITTCLLVCGVSQVFAQSDAEQEQRPTADLSKPLVAEFRFLDRNGRANNAMVEIGGEKRYLVEGGTQSAGQWRLRGLDANHHPESLAIQIGTTIARQPFQEIKPHHQAVVTLGSPHSRLKSSPIVFRVSAVSSSATVIIPRRLTVVENGKRRIGDLFDDLSPGGELVLRVMAAERAVFLGVSAMGVTVLKNDADATRLLAEASRALDPYETAMAACRLAWQHYESQISEFPGVRPPQRIVPLKDELQIRDELHLVLREELDKLESESPAVDEQKLLQAVALRLLLNDVSGARQILDKHKPDQSLLMSWAYYFRGLERFQEADLLEALTDFETSMRANPENVHALSKRAMVLEQLDKVLLDQEQARIEANRDRLSPRRRTLPWLHVVPLEPSLEKLSRLVTGPN